MLRFVKRPPRPGDVEVVVRRVGDPDEFVGRLDSDAELDVARVKGAVFGALRGLVANDEVRTRA